MAGAAGLEPAMRESKSRAVTTWLRPRIGESQSLIQLPLVIEDTITSVPFTKAEGALAYSLVGYPFQEFFPPHTIPLLGVSAARPVGLSSRRFLPILSV